MRIKGCGESRRSQIVDRPLIKSTDIGERNVDIIRNIRDALKVIRFHMGASRPWTERALQGQWNRAGTEGNAGANAGVTEGRRGSEQGWRGRRRT